VENGLIWRAIPDSKKLDVLLSEAGLPLVRWQNVSVLPEKILSELSKEADEYWGSDPEVAAAFSDRWILNTCADADEYCSSLIVLDRVLGDLCPIWNHPRAVALTRRDLAPIVFGGIEGLEVPQVVRFAALSTDVFRQVFIRKGFSYPVLVRPASSQTGIGMVKVSSEQDWAQLEQLPSLGRHFFMTQFVDFRDENGRFVKVRICFVDDSISLREYGISGGWQIGSGGHTSPSSDRAISHSIDQLLEQMRCFKDWTALRKVCGEMLRRCPLNFWGVDIGIRSDSSFVFFEANAAMTMAVPSNVSKWHLSRMLPVYQNIECRLRESVARLKNGLAMPVPNTSVQDLLARNR
jgi:hypothetical protein